MNIKNLKRTTTLGMLWSALDRVLANIGQLAIAIVLARILSPEVFGLVAMLYVFLAISDVFINSGMGSALIQRQDVTDLDRSTVFVFNLIVSCSLYILLFISAPSIANFYVAPDLTGLARVLGLSLIINALGIVQRAHLEKHMNFKALAKINVLALTISGTIAIAAALYGLGVWALVLQSLVSSSLIVFGLHLSSNRKVSLRFSKQSFNSLFGYSSKLLAAGLYAQGLQQINSAAIGKVYTASQLGFYSQAKKLSDTSVSTLSSILSKVTFPLLASLKNDQVKMVSVYRRLIKMTAFIALPIMVTVALLAKPIILVLLGEKWLGTIPLLQWLAMARVVTPISVINMNILNAVGRSDLFLKVDLAKFPIIALILFITIPISVEAIAMGMFLTSFLSFFVNAFMPGKLFGYGAISQIKDMTRTIIATAAMAFIIYNFMQLELAPLLELVLGLPLAGLVFLFSAYVLKIEELQEFILVIKSLFIKN